ncbi:protein of unknown function [Caballeronia sp. S22]
MQNAAARFAAAIRIAPKSAPAALPYNQTFFSGLNPALFGPSPGPSSEKIRTFEARPCAARALSTCQP